LGGRLETTLDHERVRGGSERALERAREVPLASLNERAEVCDAYRTCDVIIYILTDLARLPCEQASAFVYGPAGGLCVDLLA
jgi:hypothetical protein